MRRFAGRRSRASPSSTSANFANSGVLSNKAEASPHLSRELLLRAVAHRMQEVALGGLRPHSQRQLLRIAREFNETEAGNTRPRAELKPGTRLGRECQGRTYDVLVLDGGFSWQGPHYRSLSALGRMITGTAWSGPL